MSDALINTLIDKANDVIVETTEMNLAVRAIGNLHTPINRVIERVDTIQTSQQRSESTIKGCKEEIEHIKKTLETIQQTQQTILESIQALPAQLTIRVETIDDLKRKIDNLTHQLSLPVKNDVKHHHHATWPLIVCFAMIFIGVLAICWARKTNDPSESVKANDAKYRDLQTLDHPYMRQYLHQLDSIYWSDPETFKSRLEEKERALSPK